MKQSILIQITMGGSPLRGVLLAAKDDHDMFHLLFHPIGGIAWFVDRGYCAIRDISYWDKAAVRDPLHPSVGSPILSADPNSTRHLSATSCSMPRPRPTKTAVSSASLGLTHWYPPCPMKSSRALSRMDKRGVELGCLPRGQRPIMFFLG